MPEVATKLSKKGWVTAAFGDVVRQVKDKIDPEESGLERYVAGEHMDTDDLRIRRWGEIGDGYLGPAFHMRFKPGHVLYGSRRTYLRKVAVADFEGITANTTYVLESADPEVLLPELLPFIMQTEAFNQHSVRESKGSVNPYVNFSDLAWFEFALPPIEAQREIAGVLQAAERMAESLFIQERACVEAISSWLHQRLLVDEPIWPMRPTAELLLEPPQNGLSPKVNDENRGFRTVSVGAVSRGRFTTAGYIKFADISRSDAAPYFVREGDVFAIRGNGNRYLMGKVGLCYETPEEVFYPDLLIRLRFDPSLIDPVLAVAQWNLPSVHRRLVSRGKSSNGIWKVNGQDIRAHRLIVPPPDVQMSMAERLKDLQDSHRSISIRAEQARKFKKQLVGDALGVGTE